jgi:hypothetical protein
MVGVFLIKIMCVRCYISVKKKEKQLLTANITIGMMNEKEIWEKVYTLRKGDLLHIEFRRPAAVEWEIWEGARVMAEATRDSTNAIHAYAAVKPPGTTGRGRTKAVISFPQDGNNGTAKVEYRVIRPVLPEVALTPDPRFKTPPAQTGAVAYDEEHSEDEEVRSAEDYAEDDTAALHYPEYYEDPKQWARLLKEPLDREMMVQYFARYQSKWVHSAEKETVREITEAVQSLVRLAYDMPSVTMNPHFLATTKKLITRLILQDKRAEGAAPIEVEALRQGLSAHNQAPWIQQGFTRAADRLRILRLNDSRAMAGFPSETTWGRGKGRGGHGHGRAQGKGNGKKE